MENLYPLSPEKVPHNLTEISTSYKKQVAFVLLAMFVFLALYLAMVAAAGYLVYLAISYPMETFNKFTILLKLGSIGVSGMLFAFLFKFLFKKHETENPLHLEVTEDEHPRLFAFIHQLCIETRAPLPHKVYVSHEINASVFYNSTILSLFLPVKKNLLIGLGLVNTLNLSEFKAVLAHEFGHFAQGSMKLGSYVYMANQIIMSMVYDRDKWDDLLEQWKNSMFQLAIFAWLLMPVIWLIRKFMNLIYSGINLLHSSLSRQMEFNADRVAVSVTGSNAIVEALYKLGPSSEAYEFSNNHLSSAIDQKLYTSNMFYHHTKAMDHLSLHRPDFKNSLLENRKAQLTDDSYLFTDEHDHLPQMYASHPSNLKREQSAKEIFVSGQVDERSPWQLFTKPETLAEKVTQNLLRVNLDLHPNINFTPAPEVQAFLDAELSETTYGSQYLGVYDHRLLSDLELPEGPGLATAEGAISEPQPAVEALYGQELQVRMNALNNRSKDLLTLTLILRKEDKRKHFSLTNGTTYAASEAQALCDELLKHYEADEAWYKQFDTQVFNTYWKLAQEQPEVQAELLQRYKFLLHWKKLYQQLQLVQNNVQETVQKLIAHGNVTEKQVKEFCAEFGQHRQVADSIVAEAASCSLPSLKNMDTSKSLKDYLLPVMLPTILPDELEVFSLQKLVEQIAAVAERMNRIYTKTLGSILVLQEQLAIGAQVKEAVGLPPLQPNLIDL